MPHIINKLSVTLFIATLMLTGCASKDSNTASETAASETPVMPDPVYGTNWKAAKIFGQAADAADSLLNISADSLSNGSTGCNNFQGPVEIENQTIKFGLLATTRKMCEPANSGQEQAFLEALAATRTWIRIGDTLQLLDDNGEVVMELTASDS
jgi:heat shock protein HslJ